MANITTDDVNGLIALAIRNNRQGFIQAMNSTGNTIPLDSSEEELFNQGVKVFSQKGFQAIKNVLLKVQLDKSKLTTAQQNILIKKFGLTLNASAKCDFTHPLECVTGIVNYAGDLLGGHSATVTPPSVIISKSALPAWVVPVMAVLGIGGIVFLFAKGIKNAFAISILIALLIIGVMLYGAFATTKSQQGGGTVTQSHGGIGSAILALFTGG